MISEELPFPRAETARLKSRLRWPGIRVAIPSGALFVVCAAAIFAPIISPHNPLQFNLNDRFGRPSATYLLGTDQYGRDTLSRLIYGTRTSMAISAASAGLACVVGSVLGLFGGYYRGWVEVITLRSADVVLCFPPIVLALLIVTLLGSGMIQLIVVIAFLFVPTFMRIVYGQALLLKEMPFVEASKALGASSGRVLMRTILPNCLSPIIVQVSLTMASAILIESGLDFLGLGVVPPTPSWGDMISDARGFMLQDPLLLLWPCLIIVVIIMCLNMLGDALRDRLDPHLHQSSGSA